MKDPGFYGPDSITWRLTRERAMLLGGPRALLLQLAHPLVAAGVAEHSGFADDPLTRLTRTLDATLAIVFGTKGEAEEAAKGIDHAHSFVHGKLPQSAGRFDAGTPYDANDDGLKLWVHATLVDTTLTVYPIFVGPLSEDEQRRAYEESKIAARILGVPDEIVPDDLDAFRDYFERMVSSDEIEVAPFQRELAQDVLYPNIRWVPRPTFWPGAAITIGLLPPEVRDAYVLELTPARRRVYDWSTKLVPRVLPGLPRTLRWMPHARKAYARVGGAR